MAPIRGGQAAVHRAQRRAHCRLPAHRREGATPEDRVLIRLIHRVLDHATFFNLLYHKAGTNTVRFAGVKLEGRAPSFVKYLAYPLHSHTIWKYLNTQGTGRHTENRADCAFFSQVASTYDLPFEQPIKQLLEEEFPRLKELHDRIARKVFSDIKFLRVQ
ncbi:hypothetical protein AAVH_06365 [Aphelenchoides avenae]|nr:hypothetical protein AAVH_06365 [Aphelenchus avenae]